MSGLRACSGVPIPRTAAGATKYSPRDLTWEFSPVLISAERGDLLNEFVEITEDEANQFMEQLRARWTGAGSA